MGPVETWFLREWQRNSHWQILLRPVSWVYALATGARRAFYRAGLLKSVRVGVPVIIVGNLTVGGTGKTPVVLAIARSLSLSGRQCGIVSRGYARRGDAGKPVPPQVQQVRADDAATPVTSDEALLLAARSGAPVYISHDRAAAARRLLNDHPGVDVLVCDDGMQHYGLQRDLEICVIDGARGFGNGALLPAGPLRERPTRLEHVDAIVIHGAVAPCRLNIDDLGHDSPVFPMSLGNESLVRIRDGKVMSIAQGLAEFSSTIVIAVAGIGNPQRFFDHVSSLGFKPAGTNAFADHYSYSASDFSAYHAGIILMTEKDAVKCKSFADDRMWFMRVDAMLPDAFGEFLVKRLSDLKK